MTLADIGYRLGRKALEDVANAAKPDTILGWYRKLVAVKFDGSKARRYPGRPRIESELEDLVVRMAKENTDWGYDRIVGALANLGLPCRTRRWETSCVATASPRPQSASAGHLGQTLSARTCLSLWGLTFSRWRC